MKHSKGFTLIEIMVVVVIIGILASIGLPAYDAYLRDTSRKDATGQLVALEARMQRFYANSGRSYNGAAAALGLPITGNVATNDFYTYTVAISANAAGVANQAFVLTATGLGRQATHTVNGTSCATMTISNTGAKTPTDCW